MFFYIAVLLDPCVAAGCAIPLVEMPGVWLLRRMKQINADIEVC